MASAFPSGDPCFLKPASYSSAPKEWALGRKDFRAIKPRRILTFEDAAGFFSIDVRRLLANLAGGVPCGRDLLAARSAACLGASGLIALTP